MNEPIKSFHSLILNRLHQMQQAPCYATAHDELALAESTIVGLESRLSEVVAALTEIQNHLCNTQDIARCRSLAEEALAKTKQP